MQALISPETLADRLAAGEPITLLDVRDEAGETIEAPSSSPPLC